jgi:hypothetical protein
LSKSLVGFFSKIVFLTGEIGDEDGVHPSELFFFDNFIPATLNFKLRIKFYPIGFYFFVSYFFYIGSIGFLFIIYSFWNVEIINSFLRKS